MTTVDDDNFIVYFYAADSWKFVLQINKCS